MHPLFVFPRKKLEAKSLKDEAPYGSELRFVDETKILTSVLPMTILLIMILVFHVGVMCRDGFKRGFSRPGFVIF